MNVLNMISLMNCFQTKELDDNEVLVEVNEP